MPEHHEEPLAIVVMGVCGAGKTTVGRKLAEVLGYDYLEGDDFHPEPNVAKMRRGEPLSDADRAPWLAALADALARKLDAGTGAVLACSALRRRYRAALAGGRPDVVFLFLDGDAAVIRGRLEARKDHYMPATLLDSQLATLERPGPDEAVITLDGTARPDAIVAAAVARLGERRNNTLQEGEKAP